MSLSEYRSQLEELTRAALQPTGDDAADARHMGSVLAALADTAGEVTLARYHSVQRLRDAGLSLGQIGDALGISRGTAQRLVDRGRQTLSATRGDDSSSA